MANFKMSVTDVQERLYGCLLTPRQLLPEEQNEAYAGGRFQLGETTVRYRAAKVTPKKSGQFVAFWHKKAGENHPYSLEESLDLLVITTITPEQAGQFVFPKAELARRGIVSQGGTAGKMAMRVYPRWEQPTSPQAIRTQAWQLPFFIEFGPGVPADPARLKALYFLA